MILEVLAVSATVFAGSKAVQQFKARGGFAWTKGWLGRRHTPLPAVVEQPVASLAQRKANQTLAISSASLGLATVGSLLTLPALNLVSVPLVLYVFAPTFQAAYRTVVQERRINNQVMDATRITLCVIMRYDLIAALNACLQAVSQKLFIQAREDFQHTLHGLFSADQTGVWAFTNGAEVQAALDEVTSGSVVALSVGDVAPADGMVLYGTAWLDQRIATGDAEPVLKQVGERVFAASAVQSGQLYVQLEHTPAPPVAAAIHAALARAVDRKTWVQQAGETSADRMAPWMLTSFAVALPLLGANQAAAFLTTGFGAHMRTLGPYTVQHFVSTAAQHGILIKDARAREAANLVNTIIFDGRMLTTPTVRTEAKAAIHTLRQRPWLMQGVAPHRFAVYVMVDEGDDDAAKALVAELGLDDYFAETLPRTRATLVEQLQMGGRFVCYVGTGDDDAPIMEKALVAIAWRVLPTITTTPAQIILLDKDLRQLARVFDLAAAFGAKQGFSLLAPMGVDLVDIATTLFIHFGLVYSVLFNYTGLLLSAAYARLPAPSQERARPPAEGEQTLPVLLAVDKGAP